MFTGMGAAANDSTTLPPEDQPRTSEENTQSHPASGSTHFMTLSVHISLTIIYC